MTSPCRQPTYSPCQLPLVIIKENLIIASTFGTGAAGRAAAGSQTAGNSSGDPLESNRSLDVLGVAVSPLWCHALDLLGRVNKLEKPILQTKRYRDQL